MLNFTVRGATGPQDFLMTPQPSLYQGLFLVEGAMDLRIVGTLTPAFRPVLLYPGGSTGYGCGCRCLPNWRLSNPASFYYLRLYG